MLEKINIKIAEMALTYGSVLKIVIDLGTRHADGSREDIVKEYSYNSRDKYTNVNKLSTLVFSPRWYLTIETKSKKDLGKKESICILPKQVPTLIKLMHNMGMVLSSEDLFIINDRNPNDVRLEVSDTFKGRSVSGSFGFKGNDIITATPEVLYHDNSMPIEGLLVSINGNTNISFGMSIQEIEFIKYLLSVTDFTSIVAQIISSIGIPNEIQNIDMDSHRGSSIINDMPEKQYTRSTRQGNSNIVNKLMGRDKDLGLKDLL
ncbi:MAG: hypothetical protein ACRC0G_07830 [Fusobacteriaceae bacterium]